MKYTVNITVKSDNSSELFTNLSDLIGGVDLSKIEDNELPFSIEMKKPSFEYSFLFTKEDNV